MKDENGFEIVEMKNKKGNLVQRVKLCDLPEGAKKYLGKGSGYMTFVSHDLAGVYSSKMKVREKLTPEEIKRREEDKEATKAENRKNKLTERKEDREKELKEEKAKYEGLKSSDQSVKVIKKMTSASQKKITELEGELKDINKELAKLG